MIPREGIRKFLAHGRADFLAGLPVVWLFGVVSWL